MTEMLLLGAVGGLLVGMVVAGVLAHHFVLRGAEITRDAIALDPGETTGQLPSKENENHEGRHAISAKTDRFPPVAPPVTSEVTS